MKMSEDTINASIWMASGLSLGLFTAFAVRKKNVIPLFIRSLSQTVKGKHGLKLVLITRTDLGMGRGKLASQCAHAAICCYQEALKTCPEVLTVWEILGQPKIVLKLDGCGDENMLHLAQQAKELGLVSSVVRDAGRTQVTPGSVTAVGIGPGDADRVDKVTGHLKLL